MMRWMRQKLARWFLQYDNPFLGSCHVRRDKRGRLAELLLLGYCICFPLMPLMEELIWAPLIISLFGGCFVLARVYLPLTTMLLFSAETRLKEWDDRLKHTPVTWNMLYWARMKILMRRWGMLALSGVAAVIVAAAPWNRSYPGYWRELLWLGFPLVVYTGFLMYLAAMSLTARSIAAGVGRLIGSVFAYGFLTIALSWCGAIMSDVFMRLNMLFLVYLGAAFLLLAWLGPQKVAALDKKRDPTRDWGLIYWLQCLLRLRDNPWFDEWRAHSRRERERLVLPLKIGAWIVVGWIVVRFVNILINGSESYGYRSMRSQGQDDVLPWELLIFCAALVFTALLSARAIIACALQKSGVPAGRARDYYWGRTFPVLREGWFTAVILILLTLNSSMPGILGYSYREDSAPVLVLHAVLTAGLGLVLLLGALSAACESRRRRLITIVSGGALFVALMIALGSWWSDNEVLQFLLYKNPESYAPYSIPDSASVEEFYVAFTASIALLIAPGPLFAWLQDRITIVRQRVELLR